MSCEIWFKLTQVSGEKSIKVWQMEILLPLYARYGSPIPEDYLLCIYKVVRQLSLFH